MIQEDQKLNTAKTGPAMPRVRILAQPPLDGEWPGPPLFPTC